jgi:hypothetical protein
MESNSNSPSQPFLSIACSFIVEFQTKCDFVGQYHTLYYEVDTSGPGRKAATINIGLQAGLMTTPISNKSFRDITCKMLHAGQTCGNNITVYCDIPKTLVRDRGSH